MKDPTKDFNACEDFLLLVISALMIAATMHVMEMKTTSDLPKPNTPIGPDPHLVWTLDEKSRKNILTDICDEVINKFVQFSFFNEPSPERMATPKGYLD